MRFGAILGYSKPMGYPKAFDQTLLAELGIEQAVASGSGYNSWMGLGIRRQLSATGVLDLGVQFDISRVSSEPYSPLKLTLGYSFNF